MSKRQLKAIVDTLSFEEKDALQSIIYNGAGADLHGADMEKLKNLDLVYLKANGDNNRPGPWVYCGGPIGEFFEVTQGV